MLYPTQNAACGTATRPDGSKLVVVAGGISITERKNEVQIYNVEKGEWFMGPELPRTTYGAEAIQSGNSFFVLGGESGDGWDNYISTMYEFDAVNMTWIEREESLALARMDFYVINVNREDYCQ